VVGIVSANKRNIQRLLRAVLLWLCHRGRRTRSTRVYRCLPAPRRKRYRHIFGIYINISTTTRRLASIQTKTRQAGNPRKDVCLPAILMLRSKPLLTNSASQRLNDKSVRKDDTVKHCFPNLPFQRFRLNRCFVHSDSLRVNIIQLRHCLLKGHVR
jgi:hypothetical protein